MRFSSRKQKTNIGIQKHWLDVRIKKRYTYLTSNSIQQEEKNTSECAGRCNLILNGGHLIMEMSRKARRGILKSDFDNARQSLLNKQFSELALAVPIGSLVTLDRSRFDATHTTGLEVICLKLNSFGYNLQCFVCLLEYISVGSISSNKTKITI